MIILGSTFLGADYSYSPTPTNVDDIRQTKIGNADFDTFVISTDSNMEESKEIDTTWNNNSILSANYEHSLSAGNIEYVLNNTSDIIIQKRLKGDFTWTTIYRKAIQKIEDFDITYIDNIVQNKKTYEYACVGLLNGVENGRDIKEIMVSFDGIFISDLTHNYGTILDIGSIDTTRNNYKLTKQEIPMYRYPFAHTFGDLNYDSGEVSGYFVPMNDNCDFELEKSFEYQKNIMDWLTNGMPKILKSFDGRMWMINVDGSPTDSMDGHWQHRIIDFQWYESGDYTDEEDLYESGLSNVSSEFWGKNGNYVQIPSDEKYGNYDKDIIIDDNEPFMPKNNLVWIEY